MGMNPETGKLYRISEQDARHRQRLTFAVGEYVTVKGGRFRIAEVTRDGLRLEGMPIEPRVGRNESCPCGSGEKYKKCCLTLGQKVKSGGDAA